jgi:glycosyltransferase involved in cell wall biosynthesis
VTFRIGIDARKAADFGVGTYIRELVGALARAPGAGDFEFVLFVRPGETAFDGLPANFSTAPEPAGGYSISELTTFPLRLRRAALDLFHATHYVLPPAAAPRAVVTIHDTLHLRFPEDLPSHAARVYAGFFLRRSLKRARRVIAVSQAARSDLVRLDSCAAGKIRVIEHGVSAGFRANLPPEEAARVREKLGLPQRYALAVGGDRPHKNIARLLTAWARLAREGFDLPLVVAGPRRRPGDPLTAEAQCLGLRDLVRFPGEVAREDMPGLYAGARLLVFPSLGEGYGLPVVEAMACGVPVVTSSVSALPEAAGGAARLVDPLDEGEIARAVEEVAKDGRLREELIGRGLARAAVLSWASAAQATLEVYREALALPPTFPLPAGEGGASSAG